MERKKKKEPSKWKCGSDTEHKGLQAEKKIKKQNKEKEKERKKKRRREKNSHLIPFLITPITMPRAALHIISSKICK